MRAVLRRLTLTDYRSYEQAVLALDGRPVVLSGANGAGKTNLLEAVSYLAAGKGLRGAAIAELGRRRPGEPAGRAWSIATLVEGPLGDVRLGTGVEGAAAPRRTVRLDGETVPPSRLAEHLRLVWLTPAQDRLFIEGASERRRFLDRLTFAAEPSHAGVANIYERALRERMRLLTDGRADPVWLDALEARLGEAGVRLADARVRTLDLLQAEIDARLSRPFPQAMLSLTGEWSRPDPVADAPRLAEAFSGARARDAAAGRALTGPHRTDLQVRHKEKDRPAAECSTGEQKALILNLALAQAARLSRAESSPSPILLLDEVAAHLDQQRRAALFEEITALGLQAFLTGTDRALFQHRPGWAQEVQVDASQLTPLED